MMMTKRLMLRRMFSLLMASTVGLVVYNKVIAIMSPRLQPSRNPFQIADKSITPVNGTRHFMVGAYLEHRVRERSVRIISIFHQDPIQPLYCVFYCGTHWANGTEAEVQLHPELFAIGFPFVAADVLCPCPPGCDGSHVTLSTRFNVKHAQDHSFLHIRNLQTRQENETFRFDFTVCVSNLFGGYNNVLQVTQTLEMYRLLGVQHVVLYNTSCGPDLDTLLQSYIQEGFVEVVPWPIDQYMKPSPGWLFGEHGGDIHYYGQLATLNDCLYRQMYLSRYVLLNDIDEIITPYQHETLPQLMEELQREHPKAGVFKVENHIFPKTQFDPSGRFKCLWRNVPGRNIMEHIYRQEPSNRFGQMKLIIQPRAVLKTSVHYVLDNLSETVHLPPQVCRLLHVRAPRPEVSKKELHEDKRLWDYARQLVPNVNKALQRAGLLI